MKKLTPEQLLKKNRSLETMLSKARSERGAAFDIAVEAVGAVKELKNNEVEKAVETLGRALERAASLCRAFDGQAGSGAGVGEGGAGA